jgi:hypothetical protein
MIFIFHCRIIVKHINVSSSTHGMYLVRYTLCILRFLQDALSLMLSLWNMHCHSIFYPFILNLCWDRKCLWCHLQLFCFIRYMWLACFIFIFVFVNWTFGIPSCWNFVKCMLWLCCVGFHGLWFNRLQLEQFPLFCGLIVAMYLFYDCSACDWVLFYELLLFWFNCDLFYILGLAKGIYWI